MCPASPVSRTVSAMTLRFQLLIFILLFHGVSSIYCYYCLNCTSIETEKRVMHLCTYKYTHCAAVQVTMKLESSSSLPEQKATLFLCALSMTCTEHFTSPSFKSVTSCYICNQDFCNAFVDKPFKYQSTSSQSHILRRYLIAFGFTMTALFSFAIMK